MVHGQLYVNYMTDLAIDSRIFLTDELDLALQELDIIFNTTNTELIGYPNFGTNFEQFLWQLTPSTEQLENYISNKIYKESLYLSNFKVNINVSVANDNNDNMMYIVVIDIIDPNTKDKKTRVYKLN